MDQNKIQKKFRRINQKFSTRNPHIEIGKKHRITRVDQPGGCPGRPLSRKSDLRRDRWETPNHVKKKQKSVLRRENVICKGCEGPVPNKSLACCEMEGQGVWEGVASDDARGRGGWPGTAHTGLHSEGNGNPWKNLSGEETWSEYHLHARLRGRVNTGSLLPRAVSVYSCHPCIIINNALFLSGKWLGLDEKLYSQLKQRGKPWRWGDWLDSCCRNPGEKWCGQEHRDAYESRLMDWRWILEVESQDLLVDWMLGKGREASGTCLSFWTEQ